MSDYIPSRLDAPEVIGFWPIDEALCLIVPFALGILFSQVVIGVISSYVLFRGMRKLKAGRGLSWILHAAYWHLPNTIFVTKRLPPSYIRYYQG